MGEGEDECKRCQIHSRVHRASRRAPIPDTTSQLCGRTPASGGPQEPGTESQEAKMSECVPASVYLFVSPTSGVPQNVVVVPLASRPSLQRPKSVRTMWPWESSRMFSGFRSLDLKTWLFTWFLPGCSLQLPRIVHKRALPDQFLTCTRCEGSGGNQGHWLFQQRRTWLGAPGRSSPSGDDRTAGEKKKTTCHQHRQ